MMGGSLVFCYFLTLESDDTPMAEIRKMKSVKRSENNETYIEVLNR